jgi:hypothetical protein
MKHMFKMLKWETEAPLVMLRFLQKVVADTKGKNALKVY